MFTVAPAFIAPVFTFPEWIALIVFAVFMIPSLIILIFTTLNRNIKEDGVNNPVIVIDPDGEIPPYEHMDLSHIPDRREVDENAAIENSISEIEESLANEPAEKEDVAPAEEADVREATDESMQDLFADEEITSDVTDAEDETDEEVIIEEEDLGEKAASDIASAVARSLEDKVDAEKEEEPSADPDALKLAVAEALEDAVILENEEEGSAEETSAVIVPVVAEENEDDDEDEENDDEALATVEVMANGFGSGRAIDFIDVKENPEEYQFRLDRQSRGEIELVSRYRVSFQAKLVQSAENVQEYYSAIKNALLGFKGVKARTSWNYEAFNKGRMHVAKMIVKPRSLYLYLAIDPAALADTKYTFVDVSEKKKYASTPVLMKIKGERKFKHALELVTMLCGDQMELPFMESEPVDYKMQAMTQEEMIDAGLIKHMVGYILLPTEEAVAVSAEAAEEAPAVSADGTGETAPETEAEQQ